MLHGFGADADDLVPLAAQLDPEHDYDWFFPQAPVPLPAVGYAWFPQRPDLMEQAIYGDYFQRIESLDPPGLERSAEILVDLLSSFKLPIEQTVIGGFSQGAMVVCETVVQSLTTSGRMPAGLLLLSTSLVAGERWRKILLSIDHQTTDHQKTTNAISFQKRPTCPFFQSHGTQDMLLPLPAATKLNALLIEAGFDGELVTFDDGHTLPGQLLPIIAERLRAWLSRQQPIATARRHAPD